MPWPAADGLHGVCPAALWSGDFSYLLLGLDPAVPTRCRGLGVSRWALGADVGVAETSQGWHGRRYRGAANGKSVPLSSWLLGRSRAVPRVFSMCHNVCGWLCTMKGLRSKSVVQANRAPAGIVREGCGLCSGVFEVLLEISYFSPLSLTLKPVLQAFVGVFHIQNLHTCSSKRKEGGCRAERSCTFACCRSDKKWKLYPEKQIKGGNLTVTVGSGCFPCRCLRCNLHSHITCCGKINGEPNRRLMPSINFCST